jgi:Cu-processing system permease protein
MFGGFFSIMLLTLHEARRRKLVYTAMIGALVFVAVVAVGMYFGKTKGAVPSPLINHILMAFITVVGLYAAHFFVILITIILALDTISGEIASGVMQTVASKPVRRSDILFGKWAAYFCVSSSFAFVIVGGVLIAAKIFGGIHSPHLLQGLSLMLMEIALTLTIVIVGGTLFGTIVNGIVSFCFFAIAFIGGWLEHIGAVANNEGSRITGVALSLLSPGDAIWRLAAFHLQPEITRSLPANPFISTELANGWMLAWALLYSLVLFVVGLRVFSRLSL